MGMSYYNPYRAKAIQNQQKGQPKPSGKSQQQQPKQQEGRQQAKSSDHGGFDSLLVDRKCKIKTGTGEVIEGLITAASKYFYLMNVDGQIIIVNKAWVVSVMPVQSPTNNQQNNNTNNNAAGGTNGGEQTSRSR
jgi:hypothetical protein